MKRLTRTIPPKSGPTAQGLNVPLKQVKIVRSKKPKLAKKAGD